MREHELELIAALAEGRLENEAEARALIASSEEARAEFEAQTTALEVLEGASSVRMADAERASLRRDLWTELRAPAPATASSRPWYFRWTPVAAGMFVLVGLVAVLSQSGGLGGMEAADQGADGTTLAASETTDAVAEELDGAGDDAGGEAAEQPTVSTTSNATDGDLGASAPPAAAAFYSAEAEDIRSGEETGPQTRAQDTPSPDELQDCLEQAGLGAYQVQDVNPAPDETDGAEVPDEAVPYIAAIPRDADLANAEVVFVALDMCEVIHIDR